MAVDRSLAAVPEPLPIVQRALALWPRLDRASLRRAKGDPDRIARIVERRTGRSREEILAMLDSSHR